MKKLKKLLILLLLCSSAFGQWQTGMKPMLGQQIDHLKSNGLVGYWLMNEGAGATVRDLSGNGNAGSLVADAHFIPGKYGPALNFDGTGDWMQASIPPLLNTSSYTYVLSLKWTYVTNKIILNVKDSVNDRHILILQVNDLLCIYRHYGAAENYASSFAKLSNDQHQIAVVCHASRTAPELYLDGVLQTDLGTPSGYGENGNANDLRLGGRLAAGYESTADVDYLMLYNCDLSASEIVQLYNEPFAMFEPAFYTWWGGALGGGAEEVSNSGSPGGVKSGGKDCGKSAGKQN